MQYHICEHLTLRLSAHQCDIALEALKIYMHNVDLVCKMMPSLHNISL